MVCRSKLPLAMYSTWKLWSPAFGGWLPLGTLLPVIYKWWQACVVLSHYCHWLLDEWVWDIKWGNQQLLQLLCEFVCIPWCQKLQWNVRCISLFKGFCETLIASVLPMVFQWSSSGFAVVFQCVPIMKINTGSPLEHHWLLASASVVPVASQCTCGFSGLPVWPVQLYPSVLTESGLQVIRSGHFPACDPLCIHLVWWELFELNWFNLTCNPKYQKTIVVVISKTCTE